MIRTQLQEVPPHATPPCARFTLCDGGHSFLDCLIDLLVACEGQIQSSQREWIVETMWRTKAHLLTLAVTFFHGTDNLDLNHYHVDNEPVVIVTLKGTHGETFSGHLWWTKFGESAIGKVARQTLSKSSGPPRC